jgi:hypothetical protein
MGIATIPVTGGWSDPLCVPLDLQGQFQEQTCPNQVSEDSKERQYD